MYLKKTGVYDEQIWKSKYAPMGGDAHWKEGRSAMELARYMTAHLPYAPYEIERALSTLTDKEAVFDWAGEYVTKLPGTGEGRNHDAIMWNEDVFVGIEGKADEALGNKYVADEYRSGGDNKKKRVAGLCDMLWGDSPEAHANIRYQLLTASGAILLEAKERGLSKALFLVVVFKHPRAIDPKKLEANNRDIQVFLESTHAVLEDNLYKVPTIYGAENGIQLFFKKIEVDL
jgi:hypothetical protein